MDTNDTKKVPKSPIFYHCENCDYLTSRRSQYDRHILTDKHKKWNNDTKMIQNDTEKVPEGSIIYRCECGKCYNHKQNLYRHKKKCDYEEHLDNNISKDLILKLVEENGEIKKMLFKQFETMQNQMQEQQKIMHNQINELIPRVGNNNIINNKQKFNINIFLNEKCKDAITMEEFINKIEITLGNLLVTKDKGLCEGVSNIFIENMKKLSLYERPMHCTDTKRETIYIKNDEWEKDEDKDKINKFLKKVEHKQLKNIEQWTEEHPNYIDNNKLQEEYINLVRGCTSSMENCKGKVIRKLCDNVYLTEKE